MKIIQECVNCQVTNAEKIINKSNFEKKEFLLDKVKEVAKKFSEYDNPLYLAHGIFNELKNHIDVEKFFDIQKHKTNNIAKKFLEKFYNQIEKSEDVLFEKVKFSILGNIIDYGIPEQSDKDFEKEFNEIHKYSFGVNHFNKFADELSNAKNLVYLADNSGEIIFDICLIEHIQKFFPELNIVLGVRSNKILNDITLEDMLAFGYKGNVVETGSIYPGTMTDKVSSDFYSLLENADIIISKGQGNFEGLYPKTDFSVYFAFVAKCDYVANNLGVDKGNLLFFKHN